MMYWDKQEKCTQCNKSKRYAGGVLIDDRFICGDCIQESFDRKRRGYIEEGVVL